MKGVDGRREGLMGGRCGRVGFIYIWMIGEGEGGGGVKGEEEGREVCTVTVVS